MKIAEFLSPQAILPDMKARTKQEALEELAVALARNNPGIDAAVITQVLAEREKLGSTGIGEGVAIPHGKLARIPQLRGAFGICRQGMDFQSVDGRPTHLFFAIVAPEASAGVHLKALAKISRLFRSPAFRNGILAASTSEEILGLIAREDTAP